jgi:DNA-binding YbaB/EbfC family protein
LPDNFKKPSVNAMLENAQKVQGEISVAENEISKMEFCAIVGGGSVKAVVSGGKRVKELKISDDIVNDDLEMLQDMIVVAINNALEEASDYRDRKIDEITGDLNIPGL